MNIRLLAATGLLLFGCQAACAAEQAPRSVAALFGDIDPRTEPLDMKLVREWESDGIVYLYVTFHVGTFKGKPARLAAFYAFPKGMDGLPGLLHIHGGGQRAFLGEVKFYAARGYACLSVNWGGREMEEARPGDLNTDWGAVDPTQGNVPGYFNLRPGAGYPDPFESPRNNNWYLLTLGCRRGLTFLEQQPEVDAARLGVYGHSMGGNLTVYVAGTDSRVKVAAPSVGGSGFRTRPWPLLPEQRKQTPNGDVELFNATIGFESYAPHIRAPLLWLGATNDFHGIMDDTYLTGALIPHDRVRYAFTPHMNHRFTPEFAVTRPLWIDQYLKGTFQFPETPESRLRLSTADGVPRFAVTPDQSLPVDQVQIMYSDDPDPQARFWRTADATSSGSRWEASLPLLSVDSPLFAFASVHYRLPQQEPVPGARPTGTFAISSELHTTPPAELQAARVKATEETSTLIDDFSRGWQDWYQLQPDNPRHWEYSTRKINSPRWRGPEGFHLALTVQSARPNELVIVLTENFFRSYRGRSREYAAVVPLEGGTESQKVVLVPQDFRDSEDKHLESWREVDLLSFRPYQEQDSRLLGSKNWAGPKAVFQKLWWEQPN